MLPSPLSLPLLHCRELQKAFTWEPIAVLPLATGEFSLPLLLVLFFFPQKVTFTLRANVCHELQTTLINLLDCKPVAPCFVLHHSVIDI